METFIIKVNDACNLRCSYCYYIDPATGLGPHRGGELKLADAKAAVTKIITDASTSGQRRINICWHGGEPLLNGHEYFSQLFAYIIENGRDGIEVWQKVQTNLLLLDLRFVELFVKYGVRIGTSIDGPQAIHDSVRVDSRGRGTHARVKEKVLLCQQSGLNLSSLSVLQTTMSGAALFDAHYQLGIRNFDFLLPDANLLRPPQHAEKYSKILIDAFDAWVHANDPDCRISSFESIIKRFAGQPACHCTNMRKCHKFASVETTGNWGICDTLRGCGQKFQETELNVRRAEVDDLRRSQRIATVEDSNSLSAKCQSCKILDYCGGGCAQSRWDGVSLLNTSIWCNVYWDLIHHIASFLLREDPTASKRFRLSTGQSFSIRDGHKKAIV